jgi:hypothetical protein
VKAARALVALAASLVAAAAPAAAEDTVLRHRVADCVAAAPPAGVDAWLETLPGGSDDGPLAGRFSIAPCMGKVPGAWQRFGQRDSQFRMLLMSAIVRRRLSSLPPASPAPYSDARWFDAKLKSLPAGAPVDRDALALDDFGACVALKDWPGAVSLMRSPAGSAAEGAALARLTPSLAPCTALKLRMDKPTLRLIVAGGIYHLAIAPKAVASAG